MREILFRGQTRRKGEIIVNVAGDKCDSNWVYGGIFPQNNGGDFAIIYQQYPDIEKFTVYADTVGQFTGLTDRNGKRIFEGDIVKATALGNDYHQKGARTIAVVENYMGNTCLCLDGKYQTGTTLYDISIAHKIEVIGNIHDNPELLKGNNDGN